jgi:hypothetical protein
MNALKAHDYALGVNEQFPAEGTVRSVPLPE